MRLLKLVLVLSGALCIFTLQGCGSGGDSKSSNSDLSATPTTPNSPERPTIKPAAPSDDAAKQVVFSIKNTTNTAFAHLAISNPEGINIRQDSFICHTNSKCNVTLDKHQVNENLIFKFMDSHNRTVSAYNWTYKSGNQFDLFANDTMLGVYVFGEMKSKHKMPPEELLSDLTELFKNYNPTDEFYELGLYFKREVSNGALTDEQFYEKLRSELSDKVVLSQHVIPQTATYDFTAGSVNHTSRLMLSTNLPDYCNSATINNLLLTASTLSFLIPNPLIAGSVSAIVTGANAALMNACMPTDIIQDQIDSITSRIDEIDAKMEQMQYDITKIYNKIAKNRIEDITNGFGANLDNFDIEFATYNALFNSDPNDTKGPKSLLELTQKSGGLKHLHEVGEDAIEDVIKRNAFQIKAFNDLMLRDLGGFAAGISAICHDPKTIPGDVIRERANCAMADNYIIANIAGRAMKLKLMLRDEIETVLSVRTENGDFDEDWVTNHRHVYFNNNEPYVRWQNAEKEIDKIIDAKIKSIEAALIIGTDPKEREIDKLASLYQFPQELFDDMVSSKCMVAKTYKDQGGTPVRTYLPSVMEWYPVANDKSPSEGPYIVTNCSDGETIVNSQYSLTSGYKIANVLGALLPLDFNPALPSKNWWPHRGDATSISIPVAHDKSSPLSSTTFNLYATYIGTEFPIKVNSKAIKSIKNSAIHVPNLEWVTAGQYGKTYPTYSDPDQTEGIFEPIGSDYLSSLLEPVTDINGNKSKSQFTSHVYNFYRDRDAVPGYFDGYLMHEMVYLSFKLNGHSYIFGLSISNTGPYENWVGGVFRYYAGTEYLNLVCLQNQCRSFPGSTTIIWNDKIGVDLLLRGSNSVEIRIGREN